MKKIFISSTFKDMQTERDILHERVLPSINEKIKELGETALGIDLRWGISTDKMSEEEAELKAFSVCFDEIDDSRPYFIAFLGERYGYPVKKAVLERIIPALKHGDDFKHIQSDLLKKDEDRSITELEIRYGCFLDKIPKDHFLFFFRDELDLSNANKDTKDTYLGNDSSSSLRDLKRTIVEKFSEESCISYSASVNKDGELNISNEEIKKIEEALYKMLAGDTKVAKNYYDLLQEQVDKRAEDKHRFYFGREKELLALKEFINNKDDQIMLVSGKSGSGKTTFLTEGYYRNKDSDDVYIYVPIATDNNLDTDFGILAYINRCLFKKTNIQAFRFKRDEQSETHFIDDFSRGLHEFVVKYNGVRKIVLLLDAVDRLYASKTVATLSFLTTVILNKYPFKTIVSTATDIGKMQTVLDMANTSYVSIDQVSDEEVLSIINLKLKTYGKELTEPLKKAILSKKNAHQCIYLSALAERLLMINRYDFFTIYVQEKNKLDIDYREQRLLETIQSFPDDLNEAMIQIVEEGAKIVKSNVSQAFYCLSLSSSGLDAGQLRYILGIKNYFADPKRKKLIEIHSLPKKCFDFDYSDFLIVKRYLSSFFEETPDGKIVFSHPLFREAFIEAARKDRHLVSATVAFHRVNYLSDDSFISLISIYQMFKDYDGLIRLLKARFLKIANQTVWDEVETLATISLTEGASDSLLNVFLESVLECDFSFDENINEISFIEYDENEDDDFVFLANILLSVYGFDNSSFICPPSFKMFIEDLIKNQELTPSKALLFIVMITLFANDKNTKLIKESLPLLKLVIEKTKFYLHEYAVSAYLKVVEALGIAKSEHDCIISLINDESTLSKAIEFKNYCDIYRLLMPIDKETSYGPNIILYYATVAGTICQLDKMNDFTLKGMGRRIYSRLFAFVYDTVLSSYVRFWATYLKCYRTDIAFDDILVDFYEINRRATIAARYSYDIPLLKASLELSKTYIEVYHRSFQNIDTRDKTIEHHGEFKNHVEIVNRLSKALYPKQNGFLSKEAVMNGTKSFAYLIMDDGSFPSLSDFEEIRDACKEYNDLTITDGFLFLSFAIDVRSILGGDSDDLSSIMEYLQLLMTVKNIDYDLVIFVCDTMHHLCSREESINMFQLYIQLFQQGYYSGYQYSLQTLNCFTKLFETLDDEDKAFMLEVLKKPGSARTFNLNFLSSVFLAALADFDLTTNYRKMFLAYQILSDLVNNLNDPSEDEDKLLNTLADEYYKRDMFGFAVESANGKKPLEICRGVLENCRLEKQNVFGKYQMFCFFEAMLFYEKEFENKVSIAAIYNRTLKSALADYPTNHIIISKSIALHRYVKRLIGNNVFEHKLNDIVLDRWYFLSAGLVVLPQHNELLSELIDDVKYYSSYKYNKKQVPDLCAIFDKASLFFNGIDQLTPFGYNAAIYILYHRYIFGAMARRDYSYKDAYTKIVDLYKSARKQHIRLNKTSYLCIRELYLKEIYGFGELERSFKGKKKAQETIDRLMMKYQPYINVYPEIFFMKKY